MRRMLAYSAICVACWPMIGAAGAEQARILTGIYPTASAEAPPAPRSSGLGGGFVEYLLTGRADSAPARRVRTANVQAYAPRREDAYVSGYAAPQREQISD